MKDPRAHTLLETAVALEERDSALSGQLDAVDELTRRAAAVRERSLALADLVTRIPSELAALELEAAEAAERRTAAETAVAEAEHAAAEAAHSRRSGDDRAAQAERTLEQARAGALDAAAREERISGRRRLLLAEESAARAEVPLLVQEADAAALAIAELPRVSESGRTRPGATLAELAAWGDRVQAALLVVRGVLVAERERVLREAGELALAAFGETVPGAAVATVRRRLEDA